MIPALPMEGNGGSDTARLKHDVTKRPSTFNILINKTMFESINISRENALRVAVDRHCELGGKIILASKETAEKRG